MTMITLTFKEIFPTYEDFEEYIKTLNIYNETDTGAKMLCQKIYYLLYNRYINIALAYTTADEFLAEFGIVFLQYFKQFLQKEKVLEEIYKLDFEDYAMINESISNFSNNPNTKTADPFELITFTSNQNRGRTKSNKLIAYINALRNLPDAQIDYIISKFDYLWLDILDNEDIYYY